LVLYKTAAHEPLRAQSWDARAARRAIDDIVDETLAAYDGGWEPHPLDLHPGAGTYSGAAGVAYALDVLGARVPIDPEALLVDDEDPRYLAGGLGNALVAWRLQPSDAAAARFERAARALIGGGENELATGAAGAAVAGMLLFDDTRDERWARLVSDAVRLLWSTWAFDRALRACIWTQRRGDGTRQFLGAAHGVAGNAYALIRAAPFQTSDHQRELLDRTVETLSRTAIRDRALANWPDRVDRPDPAPRVQWCHGAPGIAAALAHAPAHRELDALLVAAGELTWHAGPLVKGPGLCHGTAGNGWAFLKLRARTKQAKWLERARRFAMHAMGQVVALREQYGRGRHTLWTGDLGVALYLRACIDADDRWPLLDVL
jgi:hypothetical protein